LVNQYNPDEPQIIMCASPDDFPRQPIISKDAHTTWDQLMMNNIRNEKYKPQYSRKVES
jgi:hypothetical protein